MSSGMRIRGTVQGGDALADALVARGEAKVRALFKALYREAEETMTLSKEQYVPVDLGVLRASGHVVIPDGSALEIEIGFGGPAGTGNQGETNEEGVGYAVYVHEDLSAHHDVGQAKYLEVPLMDRVKGMGDRMARRIRRG